MPEDYNRSLMARGAAARRLIRAGVIDPWVALAIVIRPDRDLVDDVGVPLHPVSCPHCAGGEVAGRCPLCRGVGLVGVAAHRRYMLDSIGRAA